MTSIDWLATAKAAALGVAILVPAAVATSLLLDEPAGRIWSFVFAGVAALAFVATGAMAGRLRPDTPMLHGAVAVLIAWLVAQVVGVVGRAVDGNPISWASVVLTGLIAVTCGVGGGLLGDWLHRRSSRAIAG